MTTARFDFQRACTQHVTGRVLNVGAKEDPAGLKPLAPERVVNMDQWAFDIGPYLESGQLVPIAVDVIQDATKPPWPFEDDEFDLVVLGDILEDLHDDGSQLIVLREAHRVSAHLCITCPEDTVERDAHHYTTITEERLRDWLSQTGWEPDHFEVVDYQVVPRGYFVFAHRANP